MTDSTHWETRRLADVAEFVRGVTYKKAQSSHEAAVGMTPVLRATNIDNGVLLLEEEMVYVPDEVVRDDQRLQPGDVVIATSSGSIRVVGKSARLNTPWEGSFGAFCGVLRPRAGIDSSFLSHYVQSSQVRQWWSASAAGTNINNLKRADIENTEIPVPPIDEQRRIVEAIGTHLSHLDAGVESLVRAKRNVERMRAAVLEDVSDVDSATSMELKEVGEIVTGSTPSTKVDHYWGNGMPFVTPGDLEPGGVVTTAAREITPTGQEHARPLPPGAVLVTCIGATIGKSSMATVPCATNQQINAVVPKAAIDSEYFNMVVASPSFQRQILENASSTTMPILNKTRFGRLRVSVPLVVEQRRAVAEAERSLTVLSKMNEELDKTRRRAASLRRAVLASAFSGTLVDFATEVSGG